MIALIVSLLVLLILVFIIIAVVSNKKSKNYYHIFLNDDNIHDYINSYLSDNVADSFVLEEKLRYGYNNSFYAKKTKELMNKKLDLLKEALHSIKQKKDIKVPMANLGILNEKATTNFFGSGNEILNLKLKRGLDAYDRSLIDYAYLVNYKKYTEASLSKEDFKEIIQKINSLLSSF